MHSLTWQQALLGLPESTPTSQDTRSQQVPAAGTKDPQELGGITKAPLNAHFGSIFHTFHNPTYISWCHMPFSDVCMASLTCLLNYHMHFTFCPLRQLLQQQAPLWMDQLCTSCRKTPFLGNVAHVC